jgi:hypothetical protein
MVHTSKITKSFSEIKWQFNNITFKFVHRFKNLTRLDTFTFFGTFFDNQYCERPQVFKVGSIQTIYFEWKKLSMCILYKSLYNVTAILSCLLQIILFQNATILDFISISIDNLPNSPYKTQFGLLFFSNQE